MLAHATNLAPSLARSGLKNRVGGLREKVGTRGAASSCATSESHWGKRREVRRRAVAISFFENWNRYYDPSTGRYLSAEPMLQDPGYVRSMAESGQSVPTYAYAANNPIRNVDPDGRTVINQNGTGPRGLGGSGGSAGMATVMGGTSTNPVAALLGAAAGALSYCFASGTCRLPWPHSTPMPPPPPPPPTSINPIIAAAMGAAAAGAATCLASTNHRCTLARQVAGPLGVSCAYRCKGYGALATFYCGPGQTCAAGFDTMFDTALHCQ